MPGDDAGLRDRVILRPPQTECHPDAVLAQRFLEKRAVCIESVEPRELDLRTEGRHVTGHVSGTSGIARLTLHLDDRHRCLGGNTRDGAPNEPVQHHIPDYEDAAVGKSGEKGLGCQGRFRHDGR